MPRTSTRPLRPAKPQRSHPRPFTADDAARVICYAVRDGATVRTIALRAEERCGNANRSTEAINAAVAAQQASESGLLTEGLILIGSNNQTMDVILKTILVLLGILVGIGVALKLVPGPLRIITTPARAAIATAIKRIEGFETAIISRRAANDQYIENVLAYLKAA